MKSLIYIDNSNVFIEGRRLAAVKHGIATNRFDNSWSIDYKKLYEYLCGAKDNRADVLACRLWGSTPPPQGYWEMVRSFGFDCHIFDKSAAGTEKKVDTAIAFALGWETRGIANPSEVEFDLVAGDADYVPAVESLVLHGFTVSVIFWSHAARELVDVASKFTVLDEHFDYLTHEKQRQE